MDSDYAPMYSTHGHERKTHIATEEGSLCKIERRYPHLLWAFGADYYSVAEQFLIDDPDHRRGCLRCRKIYLATTNQPEQAG